MLPFFDGLVSSVPQLFSPELVAGLTKGIEGLFKKNKVTYVKGHGRFSDPNTIEVELLDGSKQTIKTKNTIIASEKEKMNHPGAH